MPRCHENRATRSNRRRSGQRKPHRVGETSERFAVHLLSVVSHPDYDQMPLTGSKRVTEQRLRDSGIVYTIFQADALMDAIFPLMGSDIPLRGTSAEAFLRQKLSLAAVETQ